MQITAPDEDLHQEQQGKAKRGSPPETILPPGAADDDQLQMQAFQDSGLTPCIRRGMAGQGSPAAEPSMKAAAPVHGHHENAGRALPPAANRRSLRGNGQSTADFHDM